MLVLYLLVMREFGFHLSIFVTLIRVAVQKGTVVIHIEKIDTIMNTDA